MKIEKIKKILKKYYSEIMVKKILAGTYIPSYKKMLLMLEQDKIPLIAWKDIRKFCNAPKRSYIKKQPPKQA